MKKASNFQLAKVQPVLLSFCFASSQFQSGVACNSVPYKKMRVISCVRTSRRCNQNSLNIHALLLDRVQDVFLQMNTLQLLKFKRIYVKVENK